MMLHKTHFGNNFWLTENRSKKSSWKTHHTLMQWQVARHCASVLSCTSSQQRIQISFHVAVAAVLNRRFLIITSIVRDWRFRNIYFFFIHLVWRHFTRYYWWCKAKFFPSSSETRTNAMSNWQKNTPSWQTCKYQTLCSQSSRTLCFDNFLISLNEDVSTLLLSHFLRLAAQALWSQPLLPPLCWSIFASCKK